MDGFTLTSKIIESLAWPILVFFLIYNFKNEIRKLLQSIKTLKHKDIIIDFEEKVEKAIENAGDIDELPEAPINENEERLNKLVELSPRGAILNSWISVEKSIENYSNKHGKYI